MFLLVYVRSAERFYMPEGRPQRVFTKDPL